MGHKKVLTECARTTSEDLIWVSWDDVTQREDEVVDLNFIQEVGGHRVRHRVLSQLLRVFAGIRNHKFRVQLDWIVAELGLGHSFETVASLGQVGITLHPVHAVHMRCKSS